jgi:isoleucyl-tRNA synthetase
LKWSELNWLKYKPLFDFYEKSPRMWQEYLKDIFQVKVADFVSDSDWTWIVHIAPYGEDDYKLLSSFLPKNNVFDWLFVTLDEYANFYDDMWEYSWQYVFDANKSIYQDLKLENKIVKVETINHSYPHCWRCDTPLIYKAVDSWFVNEPSKTAELVEEWQKINFVPKAIKKRFLNIIWTAPDWNISRNRYWWAPIPVWEAEDGEIYVPWSIAEIEEMSWQKVIDLHRPHIDTIILKSPTTWKDMKRVPFVLDCWFESGAMPFAQDHYPFAWKENLNYPADFIVESLDQTRWRFRALHVLWTLNHWQTSYKNVLVTWMIMAEDWKKMSKKLKNYPDPRILLNKYWWDSFRLYVLSSPLIKSEQLRFSEKWVEQMMKDFIIPMENVYKFFETYAKIDNYKNEWTEVFRIRHAQAKNNDNLDNKTFDDDLTMVWKNAMEATAAPALITTVCSFIIKKHP